MTDAQIDDYIYIHFGDGITKGQRAKYRDFARDILRAAQAVPEAEPHVCDPAPPLDPKARELLERAMRLLDLLGEVAEAHRIDDYLKGKQ